MARAHWVTKGAPKKKKKKKGKGKKETEKERKKKEQKKGRKEKNEEQRPFSYHEFRLLSWSATFAIIVILDLWKGILPQMTFDLTHVKIICVNLPKGHYVQSHENTSLTFFSKNLGQKDNNPKGPLDDLKFDS